MRAGERRERQKQQHSATSDDLSTILSMGHVAGRKAQRGTRTRHANRTRSVTIVMARVTIDDGAHLRGPQTGHYGGIIEEKESPRGGP